MAKYIYKDMASHEHTEYQHHEIYTRYTDASLNMFWRSTQHDRVHPRQMTVTQMNIPVNVHTSYT